MRNLTDYQAKYGFAYEQEPVPVENGWICPVCGRGVSPSVQVCPCRGVSVSNMVSTGMQIRSCGGTWVFCNGVCESCRRTTSNRIN
jgi:hypothetical protein